MLDGCSWRAWVVRALVAGIGGAGATAHVATASCLNGSRLTIELLMPGVPCPVSLPANGVANGGGAAAPADAPKKQSPKVHSVASEEDLVTLHNLLADAQEAQAKYSRFTQEQVDEIFVAAALAANQARLPLAKMAVEETRMGLVEDKVTKNHFASEFVCNKYRFEKTCDVIEVDAPGGVTKVAEPVGVIAGVVPTTNPTSTAIFKALLALKTRNALVLCPHPRARRCTIEAARIVHEAAVAAGAPRHIISWIEHPSMCISQALMQSPEISLILATGGPQMVRAAYSSGHPALGVGAGNTPAVIDETADIQMAVSSILTFDNGVICASEQSVVVVDSVYDKVREELVRRGCYFLKDEEEKDKVRSTLIVDGRLNADVVGQSAVKLAEIFGLTVPEWTRVLVGEVDRIGKDEPLSEEKLCPLLAMYRARDFDDAVQKADRLVMLFGAGHTSVLYTSPLNRARIERFTRAIKTVRVLVNTPSSQGAIGDLYNFHLDPSLTLGCGSWGSTSVSTNVGPRHLLNIKSGIERRENMLWFRVPPKVYFKGGCLEPALRELKGKRRAFIVTDKPLFDLGYADQVTRILDTVNIQYQVFYHVAPDPTLACIREGLSEMNEFRPDVIIALGGGSPMDAAKVMWLMYEVPDIKFESLAIRFMDIRKRVYEVPELGKKAQLICVPTTSGTGSEVTPFAVVTDESTGMKYPLADYALTPNVLAHKLGSAFHVPHGLANAALISHVIRYNATDRPLKMAAFPQYQFPQAKGHYAELSDMLGLGGGSPDEKVIKLIEAVEELKRQCDIPPTIRDILGADKEGEYMAALDEMAENAFDDQCTGANPRYPLISDLRQILKMTAVGKSWATRRTASRACSDISARSGLDTMGVSVPARAPRGGGGAR
ncbi:hypothetical protein CHLNCDRAFT_58567 [Chlorella variabilis]|uniref:Aldehyde-alcohol dehydrogenase n=1 Tax=Chlorella variabilis TaxID=554065 RepID=E1ZL83_CHLVA|nr:hypothetical protein CHLNCDRAFT_58567 [Chlorella variabilis]EFN53515.1 hypothetical protein CHLNCDRAFT_58567 [Chlorella variabilis]|eukprot:XP_005845617.1 hypothetical protein CHLNCDRAFT_58567 [Chlorella variabilis]